MTCEVIETMRFKNLVRVYAGWIRNERGKFEINIS